MPVHVVGPRTMTPSTIPSWVVNTTSRAPNWSQGLSPFYLGPVPLYPGAVCETATNVENAWQYAKVYPGHVDFGKVPSAAYYAWAKEGWSNPRAVRYPMGKGATPEFSWWAGERLDYIEARKRIYIPMYARAVVGTSAFERLLGQYRQDGEVTLWDFDGYDHQALGMTLKDVVNEPSRKMGHAFVLAHLLETLAGG